MGDRGQGDERLVDFGFENVSEEEKTRRVKAVFDSVAENYDTMNDLMSFGLHRVWKRFAVMAAHVRPGHHVLDLAGGSGDLSRLFAQRIGEHGHVVISDINGEMLSVGRDRLIDSGFSNNVEVVQANAEYLPFEDNTFDCVSIAFGLRNVTDKDAALKQMHRVLKKGGCLLVLEFSKVDNAFLEKFYDFYSFSVMPKLGGLIANDEDSYQYLAESIRKHPDQETLKQMALDAGFAFCEYHNLSGGIVALHKAVKA